MRTILIFLRKEFQQLRRDPNMIRLIFVGPIMQLLIFGFAINLDVNSVPMVVLRSGSFATKPRFYCALRKFRVFSRGGSCQSAFGY